MLEKLDDVWDLIEKYAPAVATILSMNPATAGAGIVMAALTQAFKSDTDSTLASAIKQDPQCVDKLCAINDTVKSLGTQDLSKIKNFELNLKINF